MKKKQIKRLGLIGFNFSKYLAVPAVNVTVAYVIIAYSLKPELWGQFAFIYILLGLINMISSWGNKDYLLRSFSNAPASIGTLYYTTLFSRLLLAIPLIVLFLFFSNLEINIWAVIWFLGMYFYQSLDSLVIYSQKFRLQVAIELISLLTLITVIISLVPVINLELMIYCFAGYQWLKTLLLAVWVLPGFKKGTRILHPRYFLLAFPFMLIGFSGLLQAKSDLYIAGVWLDQKDFAEYQVFMNLFLYLQATATFLIMPFVKVLYRIPKKAFKSIQVNLSLAGIPVCILGAFIIGFILYYLFHIRIELYLFLLGMLYAFPAYLYTMDFLKMYKGKMEWQVTWINIIGAFINAGISILLIQRWGMAGALTGSLAAQWVLFVLIKWRLRKNNPIRTFQKT